MLLTVTLLLVIISLVTLYTGKVQNFEHKIIVNEQSQILAKAKSEEILLRVIARLNTDKALVKSISNTAIISEAYTSVYGNVEVLTNGKKLITLTANGQSPDGLATAQTREQVMIYPMVFNSPISPIIVKGGVTSEGELEVVANPDGLGSGKHLSIWSDASISFVTSKHHTCLKADFDKGDCLNMALSKESGKSNDVIESSVNFPSSLSEYLFNIETEELSELKSEAKFVFSDCEQLDNKSYGVIWIEGDCELDFNIEVGSVTNPVVLVVMDGHINFLDNSIVNGLVCSFRSNDSGINLVVNMHSGAFIRGALISNHPLGTYNSVTRVIYEQQVASALVAADSLQMLAKVPGSWHNF
ncbi:hypothetical protein [Paraglaciecola sp. 2405UD69-4]|uniref:hypothetical protein n=1 Tax=Paraglaciecola sp. 2405UD69-4 TaxID=3391836 RepID=UPI0039C99F81